jgi:putative ABC transport system permease protein
MTAGGRRRLAAAWKVLTGTGAAASAGLGLLVFVCVLIGVAAPRQSLGLRTAALRHSFNAATVDTRSVFSTVDYAAFDQSFNDQPIQASDIDTAQAQLARNLARQRLPLAGARADWAGLSTAYSTVSGAARSAYAGPTPPQMEVLYRNALSRYTRVTAGHLPVKASGTDLQIAVSQATAKRFGLTVGSKLGAGQIKLTVTGIFAPAGLRSTFWQADPSAVKPVVNIVKGHPPYWIGSVFIGRGELAALQHVFDLQTMQLTWNFPVTLNRVSAAQAVTLGGNITGAVTHAGEVVLGPSRTLTSLSLASGLSGVVAAFVAEDTAISTVMSLLSVSLAVIGAVVILLAARLLAEYRSAEFAVMRARGASRRQVALLALRAGAVVTIPAAVAAAALAVALTPGFGDPLSWWLAGFTVLVALGGPTLMAARSHAVGGTGRRRPDQAVGRRAAVRRLVAEIALAVASVGALVVLRRQGLATRGSDLYTSAVPVLVAIPAAIVVMRCYPLVIRLLMRLAGVRSGVTGFVGLARASRTSVSALLPAFALVLTLAVVAFGGMVNAAVYRGQVAATWQRLGADAVIDGTASPKPLTLPVQRKIDQVPGVTYTAAVLLTAGTTASGQPLGVVAVRPEEYAALVAATPRPAFPAAELARPAGFTRSSRVPVLASRLATALIGRGDTTLDISVTKVPIRFAGDTGSIPDIAGGAFVVIPDWALRGGAAQPPNMMLVTGPHLDEPKLTAAAHRAALGSNVTFRSGVLAGLTGAPLPHGAGTAFTEVVAAAAGFSLLILLITLILSARSREFTLARLRVMGLSQAQARWLVTIETLPQVLAAMVGGVAAAWALALLVGPAISLSAFTGTGASVPVRVEPVPLAGAAVALVLLTLLALAGQVIIADRRGATRALRIAE